MYHTKNIISKDHGIFADIVFLTLLLLILLTVLFGHQATLHLIIILHLGAEWQEYLHGGLMLLLMFVMGFRIFQLAKFSH